MLVRSDAAAPFASSPGLLWALRFDALHLDTANEVDEAGLDAPCARGDWRWLHFNLSDARTAQSVARLPLGDDAREALVSHDTHVILQRQDHDVYGIFVDWEHQRASDPGARTPGGHDGLGWLHFALGDGLLVTARRQPLRSVETVRRRCIAGERQASPLGVLETIVEQFASDTERAIDTLATTLDRVEDRVLADAIGDERRDLAQLRHQSVRLHRPLTAMRRVLKQVEQRTLAVDEPGQELMGMVSRLGQRFDDLDGDVATVQERARLLQDEVAAKLAERTNRHLYVLSMITALLLPPSLVVGVFGMNLHGLPFADHRAGAWTAIFLGGLSSLGVYLLLRRLGMARST
ncbi:CorA family divalent cation transporter [Pseudoxanthomonas indica]|uniref:Zinc transporter n=1 Tax=Pseudoxanthomonas indica TaxID=428993 RepID=A0A1T5K6X2_9GAMM|nr:CorA family divalent cation transporter [Pseudoxanthomonas indica]GGD47170.1 hypothetical protein GCM10007235_18860 [Pseudoxanthomonas indica]SKC59401.1 zinc transporter [Pseudoxanthomonas indica]